MKILVVTTRTPFIQGGAEAHASNLVHAFRRAGHVVELVELTFNYSSPGDIFRSMFICETENLTLLDAGSADVLVCLKFPAYYIRHPRKVVWLLHQHRAVYDLWDDDAEHDEASYWLRRMIWDYDKRYLSNLEGRLFTNSPTVSERLMRYLTIPSVPLYHPPPPIKADWDLPQEPIIYYPSRLETLKRQYLLVEAMQYTSSNARAMITGAGGQYNSIKSLIDTHRVGDKVQLTGSVSRDILLQNYARAQAVFYGPLDEDYGYVTLEAILTKRAVITCVDSGGPLAFIRDRVSGRVLEPDPRQIATAIDELVAKPKTAWRYANRALETYLVLNVSWTNVINTLISAAMGGGASQ